MNTHIINPNALRTVAVAVCLALSQSALASPGQSQLATIQGWLYALSAVIVTIAIMVVGYKMAFQKMPFHECSHILWGGIAIGSAPTIAALLVAG